MNKTKKFNKIGLTFMLVLVFALALVIVSSATWVTTFDVDVLPQNSTSMFTSSGSFADVFTAESFIVKGVNILEYDYLKPYQATYIVNDIEAFQTEFNNTSYEDFLRILQGTFGYYGYFAEYQYNYLMSWVPPVSQEQLQSAITQAKQEVWQEVDNINVNQYIYGFSSNGALLNNVDITNGAALTEFIATNYIAQRNIDLAQIDTLQGEYNTLQGEYNTLNNSIPSIKAEAKNEGYNEGMRDGDAVERGVMSIIGAPMYILTSIFDVEIFGINLLNLITTIMTIIIVAWVIKKLAN